jgi:hypothetical protein
MICGLWLVLLASVMGATGDPGETALRFLEKVRGHELNLEPGGDTALAPHTSTRKRQQIARRLDRMAREIDQTPLEVGAVRLDGELAAVLVCKNGGFDPNTLRVFPIALVRQATGWKPAPVPASFENTGLGYDPSLRKRLAALQDWMLREQVIDLARLREQSAERARREIEKSLPAGTLRALDSKQVAERFLSACDRRSLPEILGLLGGLSVTPPEDWSRRLASADAAMRSATPARPWRLLASKEVLRAVVHHEEDEETALFSVACLDPSGNTARSSTPKIELLHFELSKSTDGLWQIDPPESFFSALEEAEEPGDLEPDAALMDVFADRLLESHPPSPHGNARQAAVDLIASLQAEDPRALLRLIRPVAEPAEAREHLIRAAQLWGALREFSPPRIGIALTTREEGEQAVAMCQLFSIPNPDRLDLRTFHFRKSAEGWLWIPMPPAEVSDPLQVWIREETRRRQESWQEDLLADCVEIVALPESGAPLEAEAREVVGAWLKAAREGDVETALRFCARLATPGSKTTVLRNLGYEIAGLQRGSRLPAVTAVHREGIWAAVAMESASAEHPSFPLYPLIRTPEGPRILMEIDLIASGSRSRDFLNRTALDRLHGQSPAATAVLKRLFSAHKKAHEPAGER